MALGRMCFQCIRFLPRGGWWNEGVHAVHRVANTGVFRSCHTRHWRSWPTGFLRSIWGRQFPESRHSHNGDFPEKMAELSTEMRAALPQEGKVLSCGKWWTFSLKCEKLTEGGRHLWLSVFIFILQSPSSLLPPHPGVWSDTHTTNSFIEMPAGRCWRTHMYLNAKLAVINQKTWVCESHIESFF